VSCKKGAVYQASRKTGNGGFDLSQNRRLAICSAFGRKIPSATTAVFFISAGQVPLFFYKQ